MNSIIFRLYFVCISTVLSVKAWKSYYYDQNVNHENTVAAPFYFGYIMEDILFAKVYLYNWSPNVIYYSMISKQGSVGSDEITKRRWRFDLGKDFFRFNRTLVVNQILFEVILETNAGWCKNITIFRGIAMNQSSPGYKYNNLCLRRTRCVIELDLQNECTGPTSKADDKPRMGKKLTMKTSTVIPSETTAYYVQRDITFKYDTARTPQENIDSSTIKSVLVETSAGTSITVIVTSSLISVALVLFIIVAIWKRCWVKPNPRASLRLPTNQTEPFYLNMLFRRECDQEIAEIEQHHYEEICPQVTEGT